MRTTTHSFQLGINRMTRATLGVLPSTPVSFLQAEGGSVPAEARLRGRQEAFAVRLASKSEGKGGLSAGVGLGKRLQDMVGEGEGGGEIEQVRCSRGLVFPGMVTVPAVCYEEKDRKAIARAGEEDARAMEEDRYDLD